MTYDAERTAPMWRSLLRAARAAVAVHRATGGVAPSVVARAFAFSLTGADAQVQSAGLVLLADLHSRGWLRADLDEPRQVWSAVQEMRAPTPDPVRRRPVRRLADAPLPVDDARQVPIVRVLERLGIRYRRSGRSLSARCPFPDHQDRTPSFSVDPRRGLWHCFGCGRGGDGIRLVELLRGVDFRAAVEAVTQC